MLHILWILTLLLTGACLNAQQVISRNYAVEVSATVQASPPQIALTWLPDSRATNHFVYRRTTPTEGWNLLATLPGNATAYTDSAISSGVPYEYQILKGTSSGPAYGGSGYIYAGINAPVLLDRGKAILIVASDVAPDLSTELATFVSDLVGDGWTVARRDVSPNDSPSSVRQTIRSEYNAGAARALILFGRIPVAYSGNIAPDGHGNHQGAWPADVFYADVDGTWTDSTLTAVTAEKPINRNVPGDGKFDQSVIPSDVELETGRIDLSAMTSFANKTPSRSEKDLLRQYLKKDHDWRHGKINVPRRGLVLDLAGIKEGGPVADSGWRNFAPFFGASNVSELTGENFFSRLRNEGYLWSYAAGGGGYYLSDGVGSSDDFATIDIKTVFLLMIGSYFGDWNNESNFLRAALGSGSVLASSYSGYPHSTMHHMALGETIGYGIKLSQNNTTNGPYLPPHQGTRQVHISLMGDPTLRMHPVQPPSNLQLNKGASGNVLTWAASPDSAIAGYHVFRAASSAGPFTKLTSRSPLAASTYTDSTAPAGSVYMVRAIKLEQSGSGTYFNPSQGIFSGASTGGGETPVAPAAPSNLAASAPSSSEIQLSWNDLSSNETGFRLERSSGGNAFSVLTTLGANSTSFRDSGLAANTTYKYRVQAFNDAGASSYSNESQATTPNNQPPVGNGSVQFVTSDASTRGTWVNVYGREGVVIPTVGSTLPTYATLTFNGGADFVWADNTTDSRAPQRTSSPAQRAATTRYADPEFAIALNIAGDVAHKVAFYFLDWDNAGRVQNVQIVDGSTGQGLDSREVGSFQGGTYLVYQIKGGVQIKLRKTAGPNAVLSGIFFDPSTSAPVTRPSFAGASREGQMVRLRMTGETGQRLVLQTSRDLRAWSGYKTNLLQSTSWDLDEALEAGVSKYYRIGVLP
jgi:hypothetical protein